MLGFEAVSKRFGRALALDSVDIIAHPGAVTAVIGPNGAGKSTAFRIAVGLLPADSGSVKWGGRPARSALPGARVGFLPEERGLYQEARVLPLLRYWAALRGIHRAAAARAADSWLERMGLSSKGGEIVRSLSKGNQQKLQLAACLLHEPDLVVLDEPFSGLDPENQEVVCDIVRAQRNRGAVVIMSAHQLPLVERLADDVILLARGRRSRALITGSRHSDGFGATTTVKVRIFELGDLRGELQALGGTVIESSMECLRVSFEFTHPSELFGALASLSRSPYVRDVEIERDDLHRRYVGAVMELAGGGAHDGL